MPEPSRPPYRRRLLLVCLAVAAVIILLVAVVGRPVTRGQPERTSIFGSEAAYHYYDEQSDEWLPSTYISRPVFQARTDNFHLWNPGERGCYRLIPESEWTAKPELRSQVDQAMRQFERQTYSYDPATLANLPSFSETCEPGQRQLTIAFEEFDETILGAASIGGMRVGLAEEGETWGEHAIAWCRGNRSDPYWCFRIDEILMHEMGHVLGLAHSARGSGPGQWLTIMSLEADIAVGRPATRFGQCDMAGLQARYGLAGPNSELSTCLPRLGTTVTLELKGGLLSASLEIDPLTFTPDKTEVAWYRDADDERTGNWESGGLGGQAIRSRSAVQLWVRETNGGADQDRLVGSMVYESDGPPRWTMDVPSGSGGAAYFARFTGDGILLADDSELLIV